MSTNEQNNHPRKMVLLPCYGRQINVINIFFQWAFIFAQGYGLTESCACATIMDNDELSIGWSFLLLKGH